MVARIGRALATFVVMLSLLATSCQSIVEDALKTAPPADVSAPSRDYVTGTAAQINAARVSQGLPQLNWSARLADVAQKHAQDMADNGFVSHRGSDGSEVLERIQSAGYAARYHGEIIVWTSGGPQGAMDWWWDSPLHRSTMLGPLYADFGVGLVAHPLYAGQHYYVAVFGAR